MVIFESIASNLLVASLKLAGPGTILDTKSSILIDPKKLTYDMIVSRFCADILKCYRDKIIYKNKIKHSYSIIKKFKMIKKIKKIYG